MKFTPNNPPRRFKVAAAGIELSDCGRIFLDADELVTFVTPAGREHDVVAKSWGFYATPSINGRLHDQGFKTALVHNAAGRYYIMVVDHTRLAAFHRYLAAEGQQVVEWLDQRR